MNDEVKLNINELLEGSKKIVVVGHKNPDGDAVGSCLALSTALEAKGHSSQVIMPNDFPNFLKWLPGSDTILIHDKNLEASKTALQEADVIFTLDFNSLDRTGDMEPYLEQSKASFVLIDHHQQPGDYAVATYSDTLMSSTSQMVYHLFEELDYLGVISPEIATNLYTGIMTDTGSFRFPLTTSKTHKVIANLIEAGAKNSTIHQNIYDTNTPDRLKLLGAALKNLIILPDLNTAYITLSQNDLDTNNFRRGDTEGFVNYALSVEGVVFAVIFIENLQESIVKISFRSKGSFSVNEFARDHYAGGGHINAAGGRSNSSLKETITEFISILPRYKKELTNAL